MRLRYGCAVFLGTVALCQQVQLGRTFSLFGASEAEALMIGGFGALRAYSDYLRNQTARVTASRLWIRQGPGSNYGRIGSLYRGNSVTILESRGGWSRIETSSGKKGWVSSVYLKKPETAAKDTSISKKVVVAKPYQLRLGRSSVWLSPGTQLLATASKTQRGKKMYKVQHERGSGWMPARYLWDVLKSGRFDGTTTKATSIWSIRWKRLKRLATGESVEVFRQVQGHPSRLYEVEHDGVTGWVAADAVRVGESLDSSAAEPPPPSGPSAAELRRRREAALRAARVAQMEEQNRRFSEDMKRHGKLLETGAGAGDYLRSAGGAVVDTAKSVGSAVLNKMLGPIAKKVAWALTEGCDWLVGKFANSSLNPTTLILRQIYAPAATCQEEALKGLLCGIPSAIKQVGKLVKGVISAAISSTCRSIIVPKAIMCGVGKYFYEQGRRVVRCFKSLGTTGTLKLIWKKLWTAGCNFAGGLISDMLLSIFSGGSAFPTVLMKWINKVTGWLRMNRAADWLATALHKLSTRAETLGWRFASKHPKIAKVLGRIKKVQGDMSPAGLANYIRKYEGMPEMHKAWEHVTNYINSVGTQEVKDACK